MNDVILMLVDRPNGSSFGFRGSVSFVLDSFRRITTVASFGFSRITAGHPWPTVAAISLFTLTFVLPLTLVTVLFTLGLAFAFELALANSGTWFAYCGEEKEWLVPGRLFGGENAMAAVGG